MDDEPVPGHTDAGRISHVSASKVDERAEQEKAIAKIYGHLPGTRSPFKRGSTAEAQIRGEMRRPTSSGVERGSALESGRRFTAGDYETQAGVASRGHQTLEEEGSDSERSLSQESSRAGSLLGWLERKQWQVETSESLLRSTLESEYDTPRGRRLERGTSSVKPTSEIGQSTSRAPSPRPTVSAKPGCFTQHAALILNPQPCTTRRKSRRLHQPQQASPPPSLPKPATTLCSSRTLDADPTVSSTASDSFFLPSQRTPKSMAQIKAEKPGVAAASTRGA